MTLGRRLFLQLLLIWVCVALPAAVGLWGVAGLRQDFSVALSNYERLRQLYLIGFHLQSVAQQLRSEFVNPAQARRDALRAERIGTRLAAELPITQSERDALCDALADLVRSFDDRSATRASVDRPLSVLATVQTRLREQIEAAQVASDRRQILTMALLASAAGVAVLACIAIGMRQWRAVMRPLRAIDQGVQRLRAARFDTPIALPDADREFAGLASDFNRMAAELNAMRAGLEQRVEAATRELVRSERLAGVGMLAAGVAHEINNPLAIITGRIELLLIRANDATVRENLRIALEEAFRCKAIIDRLLGLTRGPTGVRSALRLGDLAADVVSRVRELPGAQGRSIALNVLDDVHTRADAGELRQVLLNLLINGIAATASGGRITVGVRVDGGWAELSVADDGRGLDAEALPRLFEPFYSAGPVGPDERRGTGLGLWVSRAIVQGHGGTIEVHSQGLGRGSRFVVRLPAIANGSEGVE